jgi:hypothetical protein
VQLGDGTRCYLAGPPAPYGTLAELVPVPDLAGFPVPALDRARQRCTKPEELRRLACLRIRCRRGCVPEGYAWRGGGPARVFGVRRLRLDAGFGSHNCRCESGK